MAYSWGLPGPTVPFVVDHRYSALHQERSYLLSALATEESRAEHFIRALQTNTAKLQIAESDRDSAEAVRKSRKAAAAITRKLRKCHKSERAMTNNLAAVTCRMQMLEQHQWRKAQFEYSQRMQQTPMYGMALGFQEMTLASPMSPAYGYPCTPYPARSYAMSFPSGTLPSMPATPLLQPQQMVSMENASNMPLSTPCYEQFQTQYAIRTPFNFPQPVMAAVGQDMNVCYSLHALPNEPINRSRRMSLPNPPRNSSWDTPGFLRGIGEEPVAKENIELGSRLSVVGGTSASLRMQRLSK
jgi:hypothetical protein